MQGILFLLSIVQTHLVAQTTQPVMQDMYSGMKYWTPIQWGIFFVGAGTFVTGILSAVFAGIATMRSKDNTRRLDRQLSMIQTAQSTGDQAIGAANSANATAAQAAVGSPNASGEHQQPK